MKNFRLNLIAKIIVLALTIFTFFYVYFSTNLSTTLIIIFLLILIQIYLLIRYVDITNRELSKFIQSIKHSDFSQSFVNHNLGSSFEQLEDSFSNVMTQIQKARSEKEENFQYLQTIVKHIGTGLISFTEEGKVEIVNEAAKKLLGVNDIKNIKNLTQINSDLVETLTSIRAGEKELVKINREGIVRQLSLSASEFKLRGHYFKLISLQDIRTELERERLLRELEIAHQVQIRLLPKDDPEIPGYSINGICLPAKEVGGDYYDFIDLGNSKLGIVIGDVSGKGLPAAIYMTLTKGVFLSHAGIEIFPREVLIKVNDMLKKTVEQGTFVTMFYAVLDYKNNKIIYSRAGHEPAVFYNAGKKKIELLRPMGIGLGIKLGKLFEVNIEEKELNLSSGDLLVFYTDGFTDARNSQLNDFGKERLLKSIAENYQNSSSELIHSISKDVLRFEGQTSQYDDMTMISIKKL